MTNIVDLRPNKNLLNLGFEKYQICRNEAPIISEITLKKDVYRLEVNANQESWLEARLFAFHNHLCLNTYDGSCWFMTADWNVWQLNTNDSLKRVYTMRTSNVTSANGSYNPSFGFSRSDIVVVSNGKDCLDLLLTDKSGNLKIFFLENAERGVIFDIQFVEPETTIIVTMCAIIEHGDRKCTQLCLLYYSWDNPSSDLESFRFLRKQVLKIQGSVEYAYVEENGHYLHAIAQDTIAFEKAPLKNAQHSIEIKIPKYCWSQNEDTLTVWLKLPEKFNTNDIKVNVLPTSLSISIKDNVLIQGECQHRLTENLTTWKCEQGTVQLELVKSETGLMWSELIEGDTGAKHLPNEVLVAEVHSRLAHLCTNQSDDRIEGQPCLGFNAEQLEECDLEGKDNMLQRIDLVTHTTTHSYTLSTTNRILFTHKIKSGQAICLRHDHDGCVWIINSTESDQWKMEHIFTYPGFGYVEASKRNKKFCVSPVDGTYVAVVEHIKHIFIYERPRINCNIGKQWIVDLECETSIMGAVATSRYLLILTKNKLYKVQIYV